jgi:hypothetical protein
MEGSLYKMPLPFSRQRTSVVRWKEGGLRNGGIRTALSALVVVVALVIAGAVSQAATDVVASAAFVPGTVGNIYGLQVALADNGDAVAVWVDIGNGSAPVVRAAIRRAGHGWGRPQRLSHAANAGFPDLAIDPKGNAVVVWRATIGTNDAVQQAVRRAGAGFGSARTVAQADAGVVGSLGPPKVVVDRAGRAFLAWSGGDYNAPVVEFAAGTARRGVGAAQTLAKGSSPAVAVDGRGNVTIVWVDANGIEAVVRSRAGHLGAAQTLGNGANPGVAVNARGDALVAWTDTSYPEEVVAAFGRTGGRFDASADVGSAGDFAFGVKPAVDARGVAVVVWESDHYDTFPLQAARRLPSGTFSTPRTLTSDAAGFDVAAGARGPAVVVWSRYAGDLRAQTALWDWSRGTFGRPRTLSHSGYNAIDPTVAVNGHGRGLALWQRSQGSHFVLESRSTTATAAGEQAPGGGTWHVPALLSGVGAYGGDVAVDALGRATIVWATDASTDQGVVEAMSVSPAGRFGKAEAISPHGLWGPPDVAVDAAGNATVVWASGAPPSVVVDAAERPPGGSFGPPHALAPPAHYVSYPRVAVNARGNAVASWVASDDTTATLEVAVRPAGGTFGSPEQVSAAEPFGIDPSIAVDDRGDVVAVWDAFLGQASAVRAAFRPAGGRFESPVTIAQAPGTTPGGPFAYVSGAKAAIDSHGDATALWTDTGTMRSAVRPFATGAWSSPVTIASGTDCCSISPTLAVDTHGAALVAWVSDGKIWTAARHSLTDAWTAPLRISRPDDHAWTFPPTIAVGASGEVVVAWRGEHVIEAAVRSAAGRFGRVRDVSQAGVETLQAPALAVDRHGNALAVWGSVRSVLPRYSRSTYLEAARYRR